MYKRTGILYMLLLGGIYFVLLQLTTIACNDLGLNQQR
jgi:hypothetical protein